MPATPPELEIAVFGSSEPGPDDDVYREAREVGRNVALAGHTVLTGGYGGVMEAASRGASEAGGRAVGITCDLFRDRSPNPYLTQALSTPDLHERTRVLIDRAAGFVVLPGKAGTLAEVAFLWALHRAGCLRDRRVILLGDFWEPLLHHLDRGGILEASQLDVTRVETTAEAAVAALGLIRRSEDGAP